MMVIMLLGPNDMVTFQIRSVTVMFLREARVFLLSSFLTTFMLVLGAYRIMLEEARVKLGQDSNGTLAGLAADGTAYSVCVAQRKVLDTAHGV